MPGLSFVCGLHESLVNARLENLKSLDSMMHHDDYGIRILIKTQPYLLAFTGYKQYPLTCFEDEENAIYLEGRIFGKTQEQLRCELKSVARWLQQPASASRREIEDWLLETDGEFFIAFWDKASKDICFLNDLLGRLPVYYRVTSDEVRVSREFRFFLNSNDTPTLDRMGLAQYLLFDYPLGRRTFLEDVNRLDAASMIRVNYQSSTTQISQLHCFNFESKQKPARSLEDNTREAVRLLSEACINRVSAKNSANVVGLSGGLDSRTVAACLRNNSIPFRAVTRLDSLKKSSSDAEIAELLASALNINWELIRLKPTHGRDLLSLLRMKNGLNYLGMAFILPFFNQVREKYGSGISYFTGDGGDKVLRDLRPTRRLRSLRGLVKYILSKNQRFSLCQVSRLTRVPESEIISDLKDHLLTFPETDWTQKYVHFLLAERCFKLLFEGEDRNRCFFWSGTPFYSVPFFRFVMQCPDEQKENYHLYRKVLLQLSPEAMQVNNSNWNTPISGKRYLLYLGSRFVLDRIPQTLKKRFRSLKQTRVPRVYNDCLNEQFESCVRLDDFIETHSARSIGKQCTPGEMQNLLTVTSAIEEFECGNSTLAKYCEAQFS